MYTYLSLIALPGCRHGWDVLVCTPPTLAMWLPPWATHNARMVLRELSRELFTHGERPVVFYIFSGAAKVCRRMSLVCFRGMQVAMDGLMVCIAMCIMHFASIQRQSSARGDLKALLWSYRAATTSCWSFWSAKMGSWRGQQRTVQCAGGMWGHTRSKNALIHACITMAHASCRCSLCMLGAWQQPSFLNVASLQ